MDPAPTALTAVVACRVLEDEIRHFSAGQPQLVLCDLMEMGLHDQPLSLRALLQAAIDRIERDPRFDTIVLVYGVCGMATIGLTARRCRLVLPRAHDCITLFLGSKERFAALAQADPGRYWYSPGWNRERRVPGPEREAQTRADYTAKFGAEQAEELLEAERETFAQHASANYVDLGLPGNDADRRYAERCAAWLGWPCQTHHGDATLLRDLLGGRWDEGRFLVVPPRHAITFKADHTIVAAAPAG